MPSEDEKALYQKALAKWGEPAQLLMFIEETSELNHAICAYMRGREGALLGVINELVDCEIMLEQLKEIFYGNHYMGERKRKLERLRQRLEVD